VNAASTVSSHESDGNSGDPGAREAGRRAGRRKQRVIQMSEKRCVNETGENLLENAKTFYDGI